MSREVWATALPRACQISHHLGGRCASLLGFSEVMHPSTWQPRADMIKSSASFWRQVPIRTWKANTVLASMRAASQERSGEDRIFNRILNNLLIESD